MEWQKTADAVVIGGGMMGMCTAYYLATLGMKNVVVVEKNTVASGATGRCGAAFRAQCSLHDRVWIPVDTCILGWRDKTGR